MRKTIRVSVKSTAQVHNGHLHVRTTVNNGHTTKTASKTIRLK